MSSSVIATPKRPKVTRSGIALSLTIVLWSVSPAALVKSAGLIPSNITPSVAVLVATGLLLVFHLIRDVTVVRDAFLVVSGRTAKVPQIVFLCMLSLLGFVMYPWLYIQSLEGALAVKQGIPADLSTPFIANVINYLWPCFAILFGLIFLRDYVPIHNIFGVGLALGGALLAVSSTIGLRPVILGHLYEGVYPSAATSGNHLSLVSYFFALGGAVSWGLYTALVPLAQIKSKSGQELRSSAFYLALLLFALPIHLLYLMSQFRTVLAIDHHVSIEKAAYFLLYSGGSLAIAHSLFAFVRRSREIPLTAVSAATYLVFAAGTLLLALLSTPVLNAPVTAGFALILTGMLLA